MRLNRPKRINALVDAGLVEYLDIFARRHGMSRQSAISVALNYFVSSIFYLPFCVKSDSVNNNSLEVTNET